MISKKAAIEAIRLGGSVIHGNRIISDVNDLPADEAIYGTDVPFGMVLAPDPDPIMAPEPEPVKKAEPEPEAEPVLEPKPELPPEPETDSKKRGK